MAPERDEALYLVDMRDAVEIVWEIVEAELPALRQRLAVLVPGGSEA